MGCGGWEWVLTNESEPGEFLLDASQGGGRTWLCG